MSRRTIMAAALLAAILAPSGADARGHGGGGHGGHAGGHGGHGGHNFDRGGFGRRGSERPSPGCDPLTAALGACGLAAGRS